MSSTSEIPLICHDPRFRAGRKLMERGNAEQAIDIFAQLLEACRMRHGDASIETAPTYYEYGNALLRTHLAASMDEDAVLDEPKEAAARAAQQRAEQSPAKGTEKEDQKPAATAKDEEDDRELALEMMETAWSILDESATADDPPPPYASWTQEQLPRVLTGLGDCLSAMNRHADATDAYLRAVEYRQQQIDSLPKDGASLSALTCRRRLVEIYVLIAEELLACEGDVITTETETTLVKEYERVEYARGYYNKARDELQETVFLMGKLAASGVDTTTEKEDVCFASTLLMALGMRFAELDEEDAKQPVSKKLKQR